MQYDILGDIDPLTYGVCQRREKFIRRSIRRRHGGVMKTLTCAIHGCPIINFEDGTAFCWMEYTRLLIGHKIIDIAIDNGVVICIFDNYRLVPLTGWHGNKDAAVQDEEYTLLNIMAGATLLEVLWDTEENEGHLIVGEKESDGTVENWRGVTVWDSHRNEGIESDNEPVL